MKSPGLLDYSNNSQDFEHKPILTHLPTYKRTHRLAVIKMHEVRCMTEACSKTGNTEVAEDTDGRLTTASINTWSGPPPAAAHTHYMHHGF